MPDSVTPFREEVQGFADTVFGALRLRLCSWTAVSQPSPPSFKIRLEAKACEAVKQAIRADLVNEGHSD